MTTTPQPTDGATIALLAVAKQLADSGNKVQAELIRHYVEARPAQLGGGVDSDEIDDAIVACVIEQASEEVGYGPGAWDMVDTPELVCAIIKAYQALGKGGA